MLWWNLIQLFQTMESSEISCFLTSLPVSRAPTQIFETGHGNQFMKFYHIQT